MQKNAETKPLRPIRGDCMRSTVTNDRTSESYRRARRLGVFAIAVVIVGWLVPSWVVSDVHAQEQNKPENGKLSIPPPKDGNKTLVVRVQVKQPYIDQVATRVIYDGMDRVFGIEWKIGKMRGKLRVPDAAVVDRDEVSDIYDDTNAGISVPARYTPITTPRLFPYLIAVRQQWGENFDAMAQVSAKIATISLIMAVRPAISASPARAAATSRPLQAPTPTLPRVTALKTKPSGQIVPMTAVSATAVERSRIWSLPIFKRGRILEKLFGANLVKNFPVIDRWKNGIATSIKSLDLGAKSYQHASHLTSKVRGYINKVANFNGRIWAGVDISRSQIKGRALDLIVPTAGTTAQQGVLNKLVEYGRSVGVEVNIIVYP